MLKDFKAGDKVRHISIMKIQKIGQTSTGGVFARGTVQDNSATCPFVSFDANVVERLRVLEGPTAMVVYAQVDINKMANDGSLQLMIQKVEHIRAEDDTEHLQALAPINFEQYKKKLLELNNSVSNAFLKDLFALIMKDFYKKYITAPAGMKIHHAYIGGLLEHSIDVAEMALAVAQNVPNIDRDLVLVGALLHDLGKTLEISADIGFPYTDEGRFLGHITIATMEVTRYADKLENKDEQKLQELIHILISHHGTQDKGSPMACATKESFIVHYADELNSILNQFEQQEAGWQYNKMMQRYFFIDKKE